VTLDARVLRFTLLASTRPDVLVYQTDPLKASATLAGAVTARLFVSTSGTDPNWIVKVIDVFPDNASDPKSNAYEVRMGGYQMLVPGDVLRGKFRWFIQMIIRHGKTRVRPRMTCPRILAGATIDQNLNFVPFVTVPLRPPLALLSPRLKCYKFSGS
jgi:hypothetical protein